MHFSTDHFAVRKMDCIGIIKSYVRRSVRRLLQESKDMILAALARVLAMEKERQDRPESCWEEKKQDLVIDGIRG